ncbi:hypothetical protein ACFSKW_54820 [Nonomuraea mangrovi]|uniref:Phage protein n=1 Tax=Nonomuraea mangrovi TaxID=2316207 RepID=A0ABW4TFN9_9ACTN
MTIAPQQYDANDFLMGSGIPAAKFETIGTTVTGQISAQPEVTQQTDLDTGKPLFWDDGRPRMQLVVTVQTNLRDPEIVDDDGQRKFYVRAKLQEAVRTAVRAAKAKGLEVGGTLSITYSGDGEQTRRGFNPPKLYSATYQPPSVVAANDFLNGGQAPAQQAGGFVPANQGPAPQWATPAPQTAPAAAPAPAAWTAPPGMDPAQAAALAALTPDQRKALGY